MNIISENFLSHVNTTIKQLDESIIRDPLLQFSAFSQTEISVISVLFRLSTSYRTVHVSQASIASWLGITRRQVNRVISKFSSLGIIGKIFREYNTCLYLIPDFFKRQNIKNLLKSIVPTIANLSFALGQLLCQSIKRNTVPKKEYFNRKNNCYETWTEEKSRDTSLQDRGLKHIGEIFCPVLDTFKDVVEVVPREEPPTILHKNEKPLYERYDEFSRQVTSEELERLMSSGRDFKERVNILERFVAMKKFKKENGL